MKQTALRHLAFGTLAFAALAATGPAAAAPATTPATGASADERPMRIPRLRLDQLTPEQQAVEGQRDVILGAPSDGLLPRGPLGASVLVPGFGKGALEMFAAFRNDPTIDRRLFELMIMVVARAWGAQFEWYAHANYAEEHGISKANVEAIRLGRKPNLPKEDERVIYDTFSELIGKRQLSQASWNRAERVLGREAFLKYLYGSAFYSAMSVVVVGLDIRPPPPMSATPLPPVK